MSKTKNDVVWTVKVSPSIDKAAQRVLKLFGYHDKADVAREAVREFLIRRGLIGLLSGEPTIPVVPQMAPKDALARLKVLLKDIPKEAFHKVVKDEFTVSEKMHDILHMMVEKQSIFFLDLFKAAKHKREMITIFLALLELIRLKAVVIQQAVVFGDIEIIRCVEEVKPMGESNG